MAHRVAVGARQNDNAIIDERPDLDLRADAADRPAERRAGHGQQHVDRRVPREHAHGATAGGMAQVGPDNVAPGYHRGTVCAASRTAASTTSGSWGMRRYAAWSSRSACRTSSASKSANAPRRRSSDRLVFRSLAKRSNLATRSSSSCTNTSRRATKHMLTPMVADDVGPYPSGQGGGHLGHGVTTTLRYDPFVRCATHVRDSLRTRSPRATRRPERAWPQPR